MQIIRAAKSVKRILRKQLELASEGGEGRDGKGDRQDASDLPKYSDAFQPETLDGIPLPDDPELREWAIREANNLNPEAESPRQSDLGDGHQAQIHSNEDALNDSFTDAPTPLLTNSEDAEAPSNKQFFEFKHRATSTKSSEKPSGVDSV